MQPESQRLLFVFASVELPDDSMPAQRESFKASQFGPNPWITTFDAALSGSMNRAPTIEEADAPL